MGRLAVGAYVALALFFSLDASGCVLGQGNWAITIDGDAAHVINKTVYSRLANCSKTINGTAGVPLEQFLYHYGIYPVTAVTVGGRTYDWQWLASVTDTDLPMLVLPDGRMFDGQRFLRAKGIRVEAADKPAHTSLEIEPSLRYALGLAPGPGGLVANQSSRVIVLYVDGMGYERYDLAKGLGVIGNITSLGKPMKLACVYPSVSIPNSKTLVSGLPPNEGKGNFRAYFPDGPTILELAAQHGLTAYWIDGKTSPVSLGDQVIYRPDMNKNGYEADEVAAEAMEKYGNEANLLFVHFKDTDAIMHDHGPHSDEAMAALQFVDAQIGRMLALMDPGTIVVVYADHGGHEVPRGGYHGTLIPADMIVPFVVHVV